MAGHQLYDMMHSLLQSIATGTVSGSPGSGGPNLQLSPQMMQPMNLVPSPNPQTTPFAPFSMMPYGGLPNFGNPMSLMVYGGLPNFGNATSGALMPFMAQNSMPSSLPEPQPAHAAAAAATTPAAAPSTNPHPTGTRPQSHSRRSRSRHRRRRHSHSRTSHHRGHDKAPRRHTTRRARSTTRRARSSSRSHSPSRPHHRSRRSHHNPISLRSRSPRRRSSPQHSPAPKTTAPHRASQTHTSQGSTSWRTSGWDTDKSQRSSPRWWNQSWGHQPQSHSTSRWGKHRHSTSNTGNWSSQDKRQSWPQQHPGQQPHPPSRAGHNNASMPPTPAPTAAFPTPPPRPAPPHPCRPENHDYASFGCHAQATPTACNRHVRPAFAELHHRKVSAWGHRFWGTALCQSAQDLGVRGKPRGPAQRAAPLCMPQRQEMVHSLQVCHAERHRAAAPGVAGREPYHIPFDQEKI